MPPKGNANFGWLQHMLYHLAPKGSMALLLASALGMLWIWGMSPFDASWLSAKIVALLLYIALGIVLMRVAKTRAQRLAAYGGALLVAVYIVCVAVSHSALGPLALL